MVSTQTVPCIVYAKDYDFSVPGGTETGALLATHYLPPFQVNVMLTHSMVGDQVTSLTVSRLQLCLTSKYSDIPGLGDQF